MGQYNQIAGQNLERLAALSDGIFAVAMTLLVIDLHAPASELIHNNAGLADALRDIIPQIIVFFMSFITLGIFWVGQQTQLNNLTSSDRDLTWLHLLFLVFVTLVPFSTDLMGSFIQYRLALLIYWGNILLLGAALFITWRYAVAKALVKPEMSAPLKPVLNAASSSPNHSMPLVRLCACSIPITASASSCWCSLITFLHHACLA